MSTKHASISLNDLLKEYLGVEHTVKGEMHTMMNNDPYFWKKVKLLKNQFVFIILIIRDLLVIKCLNIPHWMFYFYLKFMNL
jgi:hypothetical protein